MGEAESVTFTVDVTPPILTVNRPKDDLLTNQSPTPVSGTVNEEGTVTVNGVPAPLAHADGIIAFNTTTPLAEGENIIEIIATDRAGNRTIKERHPTLDTIPPVVTVEYPPDGLLTNQNPFLVRGTVNEPAIAYVNGLPIDLTGGGAGNVALAPGFPEPALSFDPGGLPVAYDFNTGDLPRYFQASSGGGREPFLPGNWALVREENGRLRLEAVFENLAATDTARASVRTTESFPEQDFHASVEVTFDPTSVGAYQVSFGFGLITQNGWGQLLCMQVPIMESGPFPPGAEPVSLISSCSSAVFGTIGEFHSSVQVPLDKMVARPLLLDVDFSTSTRFFSTQVKDKNTGEILFQAANGPLPPLGEFELILQAQAGSNFEGAPITAGRVLSFWDDFTSTLSTSPAFLMNPTCFTFEGTPYCDLPFDSSGAQGLVYLAFTGGGPQGVLVIAPSTRVPADGVTDLNAALVDLAGFHLTLVGPFTQAQVADLVRSLDPLGGLVRAFLPAILKAPTDCPITSGSPSSVIPAEAGIQSCSYSFVPPTGVGDGLPSLPLTFQTALVLSEGLNTLTVHAVDLAGNDSLPVLRTVTLDSVPPVITLHKPPEPYFTNQPIVFVSGRVSEPSFVTVRRSDGTPVSSNFDANNANFSLASARGPTSSTIDTEFVPLGVSSQSVEPAFEFDSPPSLVPGPITELSDDFDSGLSPLWQPLTAFGPEGTIEPGQGKILMDTQLQPGGTTGNLLMLQLRQPEPLVVTNGFEIAVDLEVQAFRGSASFGLALAQPQTLPGQTTGRVDETVLNVRFPQEEIGEQAVALFRAGTSQGAETASPGLLGKIEPGARLTLQLAYVPSNHQTIYAQVLKGGSLLFSRSIEHFAVTFPVRVEISAGAIQYGEGVSPGTLPLKFTTQTRIAVDAVRSNLLVENPYRLSRSPFFSNGLLHADLIDEHGARISDAPGVMFYDSQGRPIPVASSDTPVPEAYGTQDINIAIFSLGTTGARITAYSPMTCSVLFGTLARIDSRTTLDACLEPGLLAQGPRRSYQYAEPAPVDWLAFQTTVVLNDGANTLEIEATDAAGNKAAPVERHVVLDRTPPTLIFESPVAGAPTPDRDLYVRLRYDDAGGSGLALGSLSIRLDGFPVTPFVLGSESVDFVVTVPDGAHSLTAVVSDRTGNLGFAGPVIFLVDASGPTITINRPLPGSVLTEGNVSGSVSYFDPLTGVDLDSLLVHLDGTNVTPAVRGDRLSLLEFTASDGSHVLTTSIRDGLGNLTEAGPVVFMIDTAVCSFEPIPDPTPVLAAHRATSHDSAVPPTEQLIMASPDMGSGVHDLTFGSPITPQSPVRLLTPGLVHREIEIVWSERIEGEWRRGSQWSQDEFTLLALPPPDLSGLIWYRVDKLEPSGNRSLLLFPKPAETLPRSTPGRDAARRVTCNGCPKAPPPDCRSEEHEYCFPLALKDGFGLERGTYSAERTGNNPWSYTSRSERGCEFNGTDVFEGYPTTVTSTCRWILERSSTTPPPPVQINEVTTRVDPVDFFFTGLRSSRSLVQEESEGHWSGPDGSGSWTRLAESKVEGSGRLRYALIPLNEPGFTLKGFELVSSLLMTEGRLFDAAHIPLEFMGVSSPAPVGTLSFYSQPASNVTGTASGPRYTHTVTTTTSDLTEVWGQVRWRVARSSWDPQNPIVIEWNAQGQIPFTSQTDSNYSSEPGPGTVITSTSSTYGSHSRAYPSDVGVYAIYECDPDSPQNKDLLQIQVIADSTVLLPDKVPGGPEKSTIHVMATSICEGLPAKNRTISLRVDPVPNSGGHDHHDSARKRGKLVDKDDHAVSSCTTDDNGRCKDPIYYEPSQISGLEKVIASVGDSKGETTLTIQLPGLEQLFPQDLFHLLGSTHHDGNNHWGHPDLVSKVIAMSAAYFGRTISKLRFLNISLPWGGLFDVNGNWSTPHKSHRIGRNVDISRFVVGVDEFGTELTQVNQDLLNDFGENIFGLIRRTEGPDECPATRPGEPPCIHFTLP